MTRIRRVSRKTAIDQQQQYRDAAITPADTLTGATLALLASEPPEISRISVPDGGIPAAVRVRPAKSRRPAGAPPARTSMQTLWSERFAQRTQGMRRSEIRELLKLTEQPGMISFGGGLPAPEVFPLQAFEDACARVL